MALLPVGFRGVKKLYAWCQISVVIPVEGVAQTSIHRGSANTTALSADDLAAILRMVGWRRRTKYFRRILWVIGRRISKRNSIAGKMEVVIIH